MREQRVEIRLSRKEYMRLYDLAQKDPDCISRRSGRPSLSAYVRKTLFYTGNHPENLKKELKDLNYQVRKIGVNINQVAHKINAGLVNGADLMRLQESLQMTDRLLKEVQTQLEMLRAKEEE